jgi:hypothetical protein
MEAVTEKVLFDRSGEAASNREYGVGGVESESRVQNRPGLGLKPASGAAFRPAAEVLDLLSLCVDLLGRYKPHDTIPE